MNPSAEGRRFNVLFAFPDFVRYDLISGKSCRFLSIKEKIYNSLLNYVGLMNFQ